MRSLFSNKCLKVPDLDPLERPVGVPVPELHEEGVRAPPDPVGGDELRHDDGVVGRLAQPAGPPLEGAQTRGVEDELAGGRVVRRRCLEAPAHT